MLTTSSNIQSSKTRCMSTFIRGNLSYKLNLKKISKQVSDIRKASIAEMSFLSSRSRQLRRGFFLEGKLTFLCLFFSVTFFGTAYFFTPFISIQQITSNSSHDVPIQPFNSSHDVPSQTLNSSIDVPSQTLNSSHDVPTEMFNLSHEVTSETFNSSYEMSNNISNSINDHPIRTFHASHDSLIQNSNETHDVPTEASNSTFEVPNQSSSSVDIPNDQQDENTNNEPPLRTLTDPSYTLGLKINNWDSKRAEWLRLNPTFPNFLTPSKPRVLIVTGSSPQPCETPIGDHYLLKSIKNKIDYSRIHGLDIFYNTALLDAEMSNFWAKLPVLRALVLSHPEVEFLWWMDSDALFTDMTFELPWDRYAQYNLIISGSSEKVYNDKDWLGINTGIFLLRNCQWSLDLLDALAPMGPKGPVRDDAGKHIAQVLSNRPAFEADDQSALVYLLVMQRDKWEDKIYFEGAYNLHTDWSIAAEKYEEMIENYHPGLGDWRWPLVTHFVGCKPCGNFADNSAEHCMKQMDRAFNFGDNQILKMYGFTHNSLETDRVQRIRNETD